jgi:hypothetical protein
MLPAILEFPANGAWTDTDTAMLLHTSGSRQRAIWTHFRFARIRQEASEKAKERGKRAERLED